jgi:RNA polymerase sigma-70 factor, ECF subfamily
MADIDKKNIKRYLRGDQEAFEMLYEKYKKQLYSYLNSLVPQHPQLANDLYQQTWIKAIDNFPKYKSNGTFYAWLSRIAHNLFIDYYRKSKREISDNAEYIYATNRTPQIDVEYKEFSEELNRQLLSLNVEQREVYLLRQQSISFKEIAEIQNVSINTVLGRMRYAVDKLRELLKDYL